MIIENGDAFHTWLMTYLGRFCDADPAALAKYIIALVKKDKPEHELKAFCSDQLDVFFSKQTKSFVDLLFDTLREKSYLQPNIVPPLPSQPQQQLPPPLQLPPPPQQPPPPLLPVPLLPPPSMELTSKENDSNTPFNGSCTVPPKVIPLSLSPQTEGILVKNEKKSSSDIDTRKPLRRKSSSSGSDSSRERKSGWSRSRSRSRSRDRDSSDKKRERKSSEDRRYPVRKYELKPLDKSSLPRTRKMEEQDRTRSRERTTRRDHNRYTGSSREESRSPVRSRSRSWSSSSSRSRSWSRSRERSKTSDHNHSDSRSFRNKGSTPNPESDHGDTDYRIYRTSPRDGANNNKPKHSNRLAKRCKDFDEKGYCMLGEFCPYDHGADPLVVDDVSVLSFGSGTSGPQTAASNHGPVLPSVIIPHQKPVGKESPRPPLPNSPPPPQPPPPPPPGTFPPEPYNPEAPGLYRAKQDQVVGPWPSNLPPVLHHPPMTPRPPGPLIAQGIAGVAAFNPSEPPPGYDVSSKREMQRDRARELIGVPTLDSKPVIEPHTSTGNFQSSFKSSTQQSQKSINITTSEAIKRQQFDFNRLGARKGGHMDNSRCRLELKKIPSHLNTIEDLFNHFSKFGPVKSIQTSFNDDPQGALVQFGNHASAAAAYRCSEAVLNNRFIKVFWHQEDNSRTNVPMVQSNVVETNMNTEKALPKADSEQNANPIKDSSDTNKLEPEHDRAVVISQKGNIYRTVFNPAAMKKNNISASSVKKNKETRRMDALKIRIELHKKKQKLFESHLANQKILLDKLAKCKSEKEKVFLKKTLEDIGEKISAIQTELKKECDEMSSVMKKNGNLVNIKAEKNETEKRLLDAEMDLYNKQHRGDDVMQLLSKVNDLKQAMALVSEERENAAGAVRGRGGRLATRLLHKVRGRGRGSKLLMLTRSVDHRPRKIQVLNQANLEMEVLKNHFAQFGQIEHFEALEGGVIVGYSTRKEAEQAFALGTKYGSPSLHLDKLVLSWLQDSQAKSTDSDVKSELTNESCDKEFQEFLEEVREDDVEEDEEEEDEDSEARSWRR